MANFIERLLAFMDKENINDNQMTVTAGLSVGAIGKMRKGITKSVNSDNIEKILNAYPRLSANWLMKGEGEMLCNEIEELTESYDLTTYALINKLTEQAEMIGALKEQLKKSVQFRGGDCVA